MNNQNFASQLISYTRERFGGNASRVYTAAWINRRTWSAIICDPRRPVAKRTAVQLALALHLTRAEAEDFLNAVGYTLSPHLVDDCVFSESFTRGNYDFFAINEKLYARGAKVIRMG